MLGQCVAPEGRVGESGAGLPAELTSFVGRRRERAEVRKALAESRLVTLTGFGGVGKTRLAQRVAADARRAFPGGPWFVSLAELWEPELLADTVAVRLGMRNVSAGDTVQALLRFIGSTEALLVLDNCEHVVGAAAALVDQLLAGCPRLHVLATSREPLHLIGETVYQVSPMSVPEEDQPTGEPLHHFESVGLFVDRARSMLPRFTLNDSNRNEVAQICRQLEGIPLAIELAAVRLRALSPAELRERLVDLRHLLTLGPRNAPDRQRTLDACVSWSYELCLPEERDLWQRASLFRGGFELDAVEHLYDERHSGRVLDLVHALTEKSVFVREEWHGRTRHRMLEPIRDFGHARLTGSGTLDKMRRHHRDWCADLAARFEAEFLSPGQIELMIRLNLEQANLAAAVDFCAATPGEAETGLAMVASLTDLLVAYGRITQGRTWLTRLLAAPGEPSPARISAIRTGTWFASLQGDLDGARRAVDTAREMSAALGSNAADADYAAGSHAMAAGDLAGAADYLQRALAGYQDTGYRLREAETNNLLTLTLCLAGQLDRALASHEACLAITEPTGEVWLRSISLWIAGLTRFAMGDTRAAAELERESLRLSRQVDDRLGMALSLDALACIVAGSDAVGAARLLGVGDRVWRAMDPTIQTLAGLRAQRSACEQTLRAELGPDRFTAERQRGLSLDSAAAAEFALTGKSAARAEPAGRGTPSALTKRELQIAQLVARGMTNREIASHLVIGVRTAETHLEHILTKLGFTNRAQVAAWITERQPE